MTFTKALKTTLTLLFITTLLITSSHATRPDPNTPVPKPKKHHTGASSGTGGGGGGTGWPGFGFGIPGFGQGWVPGGMGGGYGYGSPSGGRSKSGTIRPSVVCKEQGPCHMKKLRCPAKCFTSFSRSGKGYGGGGGGGGCTMDCKKSCTAYC